MHGHDRAVRPPAVDGSGERRRGVDHEHIPGGEELPEAGEPGVPQAGVSCHEQADVVAGQSASLGWLARLKAWRQVEVGYGRHRATPAVRSASARSLTTA